MASPLYLSLLPSSCLKKAVTKMEVTGCTHMDEDDNSSTSSNSSSSLYRMGSGAGIVIDPFYNPTATAITTAESKKLPSSKYKGVVPQPNGRWGAQIYEKHHRVWLGTFNDEEEAAHAYDTAAQRFRGRDAITNFTPLSSSDGDGDGGVEELDFLNSHSKSEIVDMLRKHTYADELQQSKRHANFKHRATNNSNSNNQGGGGSGSGRAAREELFEKTVTPSDVGKLNRLVIPKQHAEKHFPLSNPSSSSCCGKGVLLNFEDMNERVWRFRYSYWNSSQSYVLTKGWSRFVKEKGLKAGDVVRFYKSTTAGADTQLYIDFRSQVPAGSTSKGSMIRLFGVEMMMSGSEEQMEVVDL